MTTRAGVSGSREQLVDRQPQHQPIDHRHALDAPVLRVRGEHGVDLLHPLERPAHERVGELPQRVRSAPSSASCAGQYVAIASSALARPTSD